MSRNRSGFSAKFEEWCIKNPEECYGEMNYTRNSDDIKKSMRRYINKFRLASDILENLYCILLGLISFTINLFFYIDYQFFSNIYGNNWIFLLFAIIGFFVMLMPFGDFKINKIRADDVAKDEINRRNVDLKLGCRFYNNRVEFISRNSHVIYNNDNIKKICEFSDGLYFFSRFGHFEYIPARFFDRDFAYLVTERLKVTFFEKYKRCEYMQIPAMAQPAAEHEFPLMEQENLSYEFNYILDRKSVKKFTKVNKLGKAEIFQWLIMLFFCGVLMWYIFFSSRLNQINWIILIISAFYVSTMISRRLWNTHHECEKYMGEYNLRFFYAHLSIISNNSVRKIPYNDISKIYQTDGCMILETRIAFDDYKIIVPYYAIESVWSFKYFIALFMVKLRGQIGSDE